MCCSAIALASQRVFPPGEEATILSFVEPYKLGKVARDGLELSDVSIQPTRATWTFSRDKHVVARLTLELVGAHGMNVRTEPPLVRLPVGLQPTFRKLVEQVRTRSAPKDVGPMTRPAKPHVLQVKRIHTAPLSPLRQVPAPLSLLFFSGVLGAAGLARDRVVLARPRWAGAAYWVAALGVAGAVALVPLTWWLFHASHSVAIEAARQVLEVLALGIGLAAAGITLLRRHDRPAWERKPLGSAVVDTVVVVALTALFSRPGPGHGSVWLVLAVPALALALARSLGYSRSGALFAGGVLALLPINAALAPGWVLALAGLALLASGLRYRRPELVGCASALLAWRMWAHAGAAPLALVALAVAWSAAEPAGPAEIAGGALVGLGALSALLAAHALQVAALAVPPPPLWLWFAAVPGAAALWRSSRRVLAVVVLALLVGLQPLVWLALLAGAAAERALAFAVRRA